MVMAMAIAMAMAMVMVLVIVIIIPEVLSQVGYVNVSIKASTDLEPSTSQSFYRPRAFY